MPSDSEVLGFSNKWYREGIENKINKQLPDGTEIYVFPPIFYVAAKFEAHKGRGSDDLRQSHDFEDIIYLLDNCPELMEEIANAKDNIKSYLKEEFQKLLLNDNLTEGIECALPYGADSNSTELIFERIHSIANLEIAS